MSASRKKNLLVVCKCCNGEGMVPLSDELQKTLQAAAKLSEITAPAVAKALKFEGSITAINNRLNDLVDFGFYERRKCGVNVIYTRIKY